MPAPTAMPRASVTASAQIDRFISKPPLFCGSSCWPMQSIPGTDGPWARLRTMAGTSGLAGSSEAGDFDAGVLPLLPPLDRGEHRGVPLGRSPVGEAPDVVRPEAHRARQH